jgi:hypothetical protein
MKKRSLFLGVFVGLPLVFVTLLLTLIGYLATQPKVYAELGRRFHEGKPSKKTLLLLSGFSNKRPRAETFPDKSGWGRVTTLDTVSKQMSPRP